MFFYLFIYKAVTEIAFYFRPAYFYLALIFYVYVKKSRKKNIVEMTGENLVDQFVSISFENAIEKLGIFPNVLKFSCPILGTFPDI